MQDKDHGCIKALAVTNTVNFVYARQVFCEPGMPEGLHLARFHDDIEVIPDKGWIVWHASIDVVYECLSDDEFRERFIPYDELPEAQKRICDAHPGYGEWCDKMNAAYNAAAEAEE